MEVVALARLWHPNIVRYHQAWTEGYVITHHTPPKSDIEDSDGSDTKASEYLDIQMQYCPETIGVQKTQNVERDTRWQYLKQIMEAIRYMHGKGIYHCDLSPNNILLDDNSQIRICDFGLVPDEKVDTQPLDYLGNLTYRAPELISSEIVTEKVDIYSIGVLLVDLFDTWDTESEKYTMIRNLKMKEELPKALSDLSPSVKQILRRMVAENASERPSAGQIMEAIVSQSA